MTCTRWRRQCASKSRRGARACALSMGPPQASEVLREAVMMGVDEGSLLTDRRFAGADCLATSYALAQAIRALGMPELVICGQQTTDGDTAQVGAELAEFLDIPARRECARAAGSDGGGAGGGNGPSRAAAGRRHSLSLPAHAWKRAFSRRDCPPSKSNRPRATQPIRTLTLDDLADADPSHYGLNGSPTRVMRIFPPETHTENETWSGPPDELARQTHRPAAAQESDVSRTSLRQLETGRKTIYGRYRHSS